VGDAGRAFSSSRKPGRAVPFVCAPAGMGATAAINARVSNRGVIITWQMLMVGDLRWLNAESTPELMRPKIWRWCIVTMMGGDSEPLISFLMSPHLTLLLALAFACTRAHAAEPAPDFSRDVRPILSRYCFKCHGPDETGRKSKLRLDRREAAVGPAKSGKAAIVPGKAEQSELVRHVFSTDPDEVMPPPSTKQELTAAQKETLRRWIETGAEYKEHWAFIPPTRPAVPAAPPGTHPIDAFIQAKLNASGLSPAPPADLATLRGASLWT
jgi:hypothetical protein